MKVTNIRNFKKGAASFYIVAFATLILMIIAVSFASIIISEVTRTSNDDLAQSAYDSALAGVEDAKLAFSNYQSCVASGAKAKASSDGDPLDCGAIMWYMENPSCYMVGNMLGRAEGEVAVQESTIQGNNMQQFYTCVKIQTALKDYRTTLSSSQQIKVVKLKFGEGVDANRIQTVRFSWFSDSNGTNFNYSNIGSNKKVSFPNTGYTLAESKPPTVSLAMIQTSNTFQIESFDMTVGNTTNRGMLYFVPTDDIDAAKKNVENNYSAGYDQARNINHINTSGFLKSNDKTTRNLPYVVYCPENSGQNFACRVDIDLPKPIGGTRSNENFVFVVGLPYGKPTTDVALEFLCAEGDICSKAEIVDDGEEPTGSNVAVLEGVQIEIDSTGRANDLYRRVKARLQGADSYDLSIMGPLELLGKNNNNDPLLSKDFGVTCEWNFPNRGC